MPIYEYRCENGHLFEVMQKMSEAPVTSCATCEAPVQRVFHPVAVHFKGSGFYSTDYGRGSRKPKDGGEGGSTDGGSTDSGASSGDKSDSPKSDSAKTETKAASE